MRKASLTFVFTVLIIGATGCKEAPAPSSEKPTTEQAKQQAAQSLNELIGAPKAAKKPTLPTQNLPPGHPPIGGNTATGLMSDFTKVHAPPMVGTPHVGINKTKKTAAPTDQPPLKATGSGSEEELSRCLKSFESEDDQKVFRNAFVNVFHRSRGQRNPGAAEQSLLKLAEKHPKNAPIYRVLGYAAVDNGFQMARAMRYYSKAIELSPDYAEVHYALAFMYAMGDRTKGAEHFKKAMELGMKDERGIGPRFYAPKAP